jgi:ABC-2 type transport system ATP-binding protein
MANEILDVQNVQKIFSDKMAGKNHALSGISFSINPSECVCLLGPNGAGKTTTIMMTLGFETPTSGDIVICGVSTTKDPVKARSHISYIPDEVALYPNLTGYENLVFFDRLLKTKDRDRSELLKITSMIGLSEVALAKPVKSYSKGMKQRLGIAVALLKDSDLFIFDEPTNGLDAVGIREFIQIVLSLKKLGKGILVTTHDLLRVNSFANKVLILKGGKIHASFDLSGGKSDVNLEDEYLNAINEG